jgi:hypothetical protein
MRHPIISTAALITVIFIGMDNSIATPNIEEGLWEITSKMEMEGIPFAMPASSHKKCLANKDLVPQKEEEGQKCKVKKRNVKGNTVEWEMDCKGRGGKMNSKGEVTYSGTSMKGTMLISVEGQPPMKNTMTGKRIGPCK